MEEFLYIWVRVIAVIIGVAFLFFMVYLAFNVFVWWINLILVLLVVSIFITLIIWATPG